MGNWMKFRVLESQGAQQEKVLISHSVEKEGNHRNN